MINEKTVKSDSASETTVTRTLGGSNLSLSEKEKDASLSAEQTTPEVAHAPQPLQDGKPELHRVKSSKEAAAELQKVLTSGEGVEYPTGMKLGLISLALCLSVFLMALVSISPKLGHSRSH